MYFVIFATVFFSLAGPTWARLRAMEEGDDVEVASELSMASESNTASGSE